MTAERWLPVVDYEGLYEVSDMGSVRSLDRVVRQRGRKDRFFPGVTLAAATNIHGYPMVALCRNGRARSFKVHRLVLEAFTGPAPEGHEACHNNGNRGDARLVNLRWDDHSSNMRDRRRHGSDHQVVKTHCPQGHPYTGRNLKVIPSRPTARYCRQCSIEYSRQYDARNRAHTNKIGTAS